MRRKTQVSIKDVARLAGVSPTTVSRVLNNSGHPVSHKTRREVEAAIKELHFTPNRMAQGLIHRRSHIIGIIVHDISDAYFAETVKGIDKVISQHNYITTVYNTYRDVEAELRAIEVLKAHRAEAVVFAGGSLIDKRYQDQMTEYVNELDAAGCVVIGVTSRPFKVKNIEIGNTLAGRTITDYLLNKGHRKIAYLDGPGVLSTTRERFQGFATALKDRNISLEDALILEGDFTFEGGRKAAIRLMHRVSDITAVVASNDESALGLMWELKNQGVEIPDDISVVGIGNIPAAKYAYPPLTTISLPMYEIGIQIGEYVISRLKDGGSLNHRFETQIGLVERQSVKTLR